MRIKPTAAIPLLASHALLFLSPIPMANAAVSSSSPITYNTGSRPGYSGDENTVHSNNGPAANNGAACVNYESDVSRELNQVKLAFYDAGIPKDTNTIFEPSLLLNVAWPPPKEGYEPVNTYPGRHLFDNSTIPQPTFSISRLSSNSDTYGGDPNSASNVNGPFVIIMFDPDVPDTEKPSIRDFIGSDFYAERDGVLKNQTAAIASWRHPSPPRRSQGERYVFLMFNQPDSFDNTVNLDTTTYRKFDVAEYARLNDLGEPVAGNFFNIESNASCWRDGCK